MRKNFITKEYSLENQPGTLNMLEKRNFYGSKILEIPDTLDVDQNNIIWNESKMSSHALVDNDV